MAAGTGGTIIIMNNNVYQKYKEIQVNSSSKEDLVILAYDGAINSIEACIESIAENDLEMVHASSLKAQALVNELMVSLNFEKGGEIAKNLFNIYEYIIHRLMMANAKKQQDLFEEPKELLLNLREAWIEAKQKVKVGK